MVQNYMRTYQSSEIESIWFELEPFVKKVLKKHEEDYTIESIKDSLLKKEMQLWTSYNGQLEAFILTQIVIYPKHKICEIFMCGGANLHRWLRFLPNLEDWAVSLGCKEIRFQGRAGWEKKLLGFKKTKIIMKRELYGWQF